MAVTIGIYQIKHLRDICFLYSRDLNGQCAFDEFILLELSVSVGVEPIEECIQVKVVDFEILLDFLYNHSRPWLHLV